MFSEKSNSTSQSPDENMKSDKELFADGKPVNQEPEKELCVAGKQGGQKFVLKLWLSGALAVLLMISLTVTSVAWFKTIASSVGSAKINTNGLDASVTVEFNRNLEYLGDVINASEDDYVTLGRTSMNEISERCMPGCHLIYRFTVTNNQHTSPATKELPATVEISFAEFGSYYDSLVTRYINGENIEVSDDSKIDIMDNNGSLLFKLSEIRYKKTGDENYADYAVAASTPAREWDGYLFSQYSMGEKMFEYNNLGAGETLVVLLVLECMNPLEVLSCYSGYREYCAQSIEDAKRKSAYTSVAGIELSSLVIERTEGEGETINAKMSIDYININVKNNEP